MRKRLWRGHSSFGFLSSFVIRHSSFGFLLALCLPVQAALYSYTYNSGFANSGVVPDGNPTGWFDSHTLSGIADYRITDVSVTLNISGGFNGDLYAYISHAGVLVPLFNRVGVTATGGGNSFGYGDAGFAITLSSSGAHDVHFYGANGPGFNGNGQLTGTWQPDGRAIDPLSDPSAFDSAGRVSFGSYTNMDPNGSWTLFIADMSAGATSTLVSWELDITAVPEPVNVALGICGGVAALGAGWRRWRKARLASSGLEERT